MKGEKLKMDWIEGFVKIASEIIRMIGKEIEEKRK